ncbi:MAG TPA: hypothetical protein ENJ12_01360 [Thiolapillus brandeum]|uniref:ATP-grasp domain-containing protein n=1 Tax=Thiolapillus brandeum TaxID=1076588 RepID=A0A831RV25_9GAMM|nr:hypothetical protein [Thiolapillus brandeum]
MRIRLVFWYMFWCLRIGARPWRYFQLNAPWFSSSKRLFSKLEMDSSIPGKWRLHQEKLTPDSKPESWPVFLKPEWGQNARGILVANDQGCFDKLRNNMLNGDIPYLFQEAAPGRREFEVFYIRRKASGSQPAVLSVTETLNSSGQDWPVNSILNPSTRHRTVTGLTQEAQQQLWQYMNELPAFRIARVGLHADSFEAVLEGQFRIIEINLFVPMPLCLLDTNIPFRAHHRFIRSAMRDLALLTKSVPLKQPRKNIFWPMLFLNSRMRA